MAAIRILAFACLAALGVVHRLDIALAVLVVYGYATSAVSLLQYTLVQSHAPDAYLGRINGLWPRHTPS